MLVQVNLALTSSQTKVVAMVFSPWAGDLGTYAPGFASDYLLSADCVAHRTADFPYLISPLEGIQERARQDGSSVFWDFDDWNTALAGNMAFGQAVALVFIDSDSGEDYITVDGNQGDRYVSRTSFNNDDAHSYPATTSPLGTMGITLYFLSLRRITIP